MATDSPITALLAQRSEEELESMRSKASEVMEAAKAELMWIEEAIARKTQRQHRRTSRKGDTKKRILDFIASSPEPVGPAEVRDALGATGPTIGSSTVYNTFKRLHDAGEIVRVEEGLYKVAARNGHRAEEIEAPTRLSSGTAPHEGQLLGSS
jgi:Fe2+ or Zn2+ uptake regulation protein